MARFYKKLYASCSAIDQRIGVHHFEKHQWQKSTKISLFYLVYKWCVALQFGIVLLCSIIDTRRYGKLESINFKWLIFLTNWVYTMCTTQAITSLWILQAAWINGATPSDNNKDIPIHYRFYWILHSIAIDGSITVTFIYWLSVYDPALNRMDAMNFLVHAGNAIIMVLDLWIIRHPCPLVHGAYAAIVGSIYGLFTYIYYACGGTGRDGHPFIYKALDWREPGKAFMFTIMSAALLIIIHLVIWFMSRIRQWIALSKSEHRNPSEEILRGENLL